MAALVGELDPNAFDTVLEAYAHARVERPDRNLQQRARLVHEMQLVRTMMAAVAGDDETGAERCAGQLRRLDDQLAREEDAAEAKRIAAEHAAAPVTPPPGAGDDIAAPAQQTAPLPVSVGEADPSDEAVQVEHPATPMPVQSTDESADAAPEDEALGDETLNDQTPSDPTTSGDRGSRPSPLEEDEDDDVVPLGQAESTAPKDLNR